jgi:hypothetical protein
MKIRPSEFVRFFDVFHRAFPSFAASYESLADQPDFHGAPPGGENIALIASTRPQTWA